MYIMAALVLLSVVITLLLDFLEARFNNSSFYFSESFLFSSFWWLFPPVLYVQIMMLSGKKNLLHNIAWLIIPAALHLFIFPALVMLISDLFYDHTFSYASTFRYALTEHFFKIIILYALPVVLYRFSLPMAAKTKQETPVLEPTVVYPASLLVTDPLGRKQHLPVADIMYFSARPPYINLHLGQKNYLYNDTLKSVLEKLDGSIYIRIHKSVIVNMRYVKNYRSRLNGDYDLTLTDGTLLRVSRNYAAAFKKQFSHTHPVT
jgi:hypothetical protein